jgi:hypothetical protein
MLIAGLLAVRAVGAELPEAVSYCLQCHGNEGFTIVLEDGSELDLYQDAKEFSGSVHGPHLVCTDCHDGYDQGHPSGVKISSRRDYAIASYEVCKKCHFDTYARTLESVHYEFLKNGFEFVPVCTDCHGAHDIQNPHEKRAMISRSCAECHVDIYSKYKQSVHGKALVEEGNTDVPVCADCHTAHQIRDPRTMKFHLASPEICIHCHGDHELMTKYELTTTVATTYLADFHGVTASLAGVSDVEDKRLVVTCVDCHGVHDIMSPDLIGGEEMQERVTSVCTKCHEGASSDFSAAWLSHFPPSLKHAPLVFLVNIFYKIFIPFVVIGLILQVFLHFYRVAIRR